MCGRYVSASPPEDIAAYFDAVLDPSAHLGPSYNVAPTQDVLAVVQRDGERRLEAFHWGLVPPWSKDARGGARMINARAETLAEKPAFRAPLARRRCLVPMDGFYEWKTVAPAAGEAAALPGAKRARPSKQPMYLHRADGEPLAAAGLWERWRPPPTDADPEPAVLHSLTIVTTAANPDVAPVHDRMPAFLPATAWDRWLDPDERDLQLLTGLLVPAPAGLLVMHPVSPAVGNVRSKGPELIEPVEV